MKKVILGVLLGLSQMCFADTKISALPSTTTLNSADIIPIVTNPGTSPTNMSISKSNLLATLNISPLNVASGTVTTFNSSTINATSGTVSGFNASTITLTGPIFTPLNGGTQIFFVDTVGGNWDTFGGSNAGNFTHTVGANTGFGRNTLSSMTSGTANTGIGNSSLVGLTSGINNFAGGSGSLGAVSIGSSNTAVGYNAGTSIGGGNRNVFLGSSADAASGNLTNAIAIGAGVTVSTNNTALIGGYPDTENSVNMFVSTITASTLNLTSTSSVHALGITANGTYGTVNGSSGGLFMDCSGGGAASGNCMQLYSSAGAQQALGGMLNIVNTNAGWNEPAIYTQRTTNTNNNSDIRVEATGTPAISILETGQSIGSAKKFQLSVHGGTMRFEGRNTADNAFDSAIIISSQASSADVAIGSGYNPAQITQLQVITSTTNTYGFTLSTAAVGGNTVSISTSGTLQLGGVSDGNINLTIGVSTYTVASSSVIPTVGGMVVFTSSNGTIGNGAAAVSAGGTSGQIQYNNATALGGAAGTVVTASSVTFTNSVSLSTAQFAVGIDRPQNNSPALFDFYANAVAAGTPLLQVGSSSQKSTFYVPSNQMVNMTSLGSISGSLAVGDTANSWNNRIYATGDNTQFFDLRTGSTMTFQTAITNGQGNMLFNAGGSVPRFQISAQTGVSVSSSASAGSYLLRISTMGIISVSSNTPTLSSCGTGPSVRGNSFTFQLTGGTGATGCVATFPVGTFKNNAPMCSIDQSAMSLVNAISHSETTSAITITQTGLGTGVLTVHCVGFNE